MREDAANKGKIGPPKVDKIQILYELMRISFGHDWLSVDSRDQGCMP